MSFYEEFIKEVRAKHKQNPTGFFTPYRSWNDLGLQLLSPVSAPLAGSFIAACDACAAAFYLVKGLKHTVRLEETKSLSSFNAFGNHFGGFILAASFALISFFINLAAIFTRAASSYFNKKEKEPELSSPSIAHSV